MSFNLFSSIFPDYFKPREGLKVIHPTFKYGFNSNVNFTYSDSYGQIENTRNGALMTNKICMFGNISGVTDIDVPILDGLRNDIIDTNGRVDPNLVEQLLGKSVLTRAQNNYLAPLASDLIRNKNTVSLLYNLLRLYYIKKCGNVVYDPDALYYDNGHVKILNKQVFTGKNNLAQLASSFKVTPGMVVSGAVDYDNVQYDNPSFTWAGPLTKVHGNVLRDAIGAWESKAPFTLAHSSPQLASAIRIVTPFTTDRGPASYDHHSVFEVLRTLVTSNRLYTDFDIAYTMLTQVMALPAPRSAESAAWFVNEMPVYMPKLECALGLFPVVLSAAPYIRDDSWKTTFDSWNMTQDVAWYHCFALNEACYVELGNVVRSRDTDAVNKLNFTELATEGQPLSFRGILSDLTLVAMRTGRQIDMPYAVSCGLDRVSFVVSQAEISVPVTVIDKNAPKYYPLDVVSAEAGAVANVVVRTMSPAMYPIFTYGLNVDPLYADAVDDEVVINVDSPEEGVITITDQIKFAKFMNIMRIMGNDVKATERITGRIVTNWADNASGRFLYTDTQLTRGTVFDILAEDIKPRKHNWVQIGGMYGDVTFKYKLSSFRARIFNGNSDAKVSGVTVQPVSKSKYSEKMDLMTNKPDTVSIHPIGRESLSDFRFVRLLVPGMSRPTRFGQLPRVMDVEPGDMEPTVQEIIPEDVGDTGMPESPASPAVE